MASVDVVRAWKDPSYRATLGAEAAASLPSHPAGLVEISDEELRQASGLNTNLMTTAWFCTLFTFIQSRCCPA